MNRKKITIFLVLLTFVFLQVHALSVRDFTFLHLGQMEGLCNQRIYSVRQTPDGALWWSNKNDIERYNGVQIKHYRLEKDPLMSTLAGRTIKLALPAPTHNDWSLLAFDNKGAIYTYNKMQDRFQLVADVKTLLKTDVNLNDILETDAGIWLATNQGVFLLHDNKVETVAKGVHTNSIIKTDWYLLFCTKSGVLKYTNTHHPSPITQIPQDIESGYYDAKYNQTWLGGFSQGIWVLSHDYTGRIIHIEHIAPAGDEGIVHHPIRSIYPYNDKIMLVGADGTGVHQIPRQGVKGMELKNSLPLMGEVGGGLLFDANDGPQGVLHGNGIYSLMRDSWGNIVIASYSGGIDIARPVGSTSAVFQHMTGNTQSLDNDRVNSVAQLDNQILVMGTDNGVSTMNQQTGEWTHICRNTVVINFCKTPTGNLLAGTYGKGVYEITKDGRASQLYSVENGILKDDHVYKLLYDRQGHLWIGCLEGMLVQKTAEGQKYYDVKYIRDMLQLPNGTIAVGTSFGVKLVSPSTGKVTEFAYHTQDKDDVNKAVTCLYLNNGRELWIGTDGGGIYVYDLTTKACRQLTTENGLPSNWISSIGKDARGRILVATEQGLSITASSPHRGGQEGSLNFVNLNYCYGIDREYSSGAVTNLSNGQILLGTTSGAVIVDPENLQALNYGAKLNLLGVRCEGMDSLELDGFNEEVHQMLKDGRLHLSYDQRSFDLEYESINLRNQFDIEYCYKVGEGEWSKPTDQQHIRFANLESGTHNLQIRSVSRSCGTVLDEIHLTIEIGKPWWRSWWMRLVYLGLLVFAFYGAWRVYELHTKYMRLVVKNVEGVSELSEMPETASSEIQNSEVPESRDSEAPQNAEGSAFIDKATKLVMENLSDTDFNIDRLCREMAMSRTLFYIKLKSYTGKSPQDFIRIIRLERASALLRSGRSVNDTAMLTGFENSKYFSTVFKKYFGVSPSKYN